MATLISHLWQCCIYMYITVFFTVSFQLSENTSALLWCTTRDHAHSLVSMSDSDAVVDAINAAFVSKVKYPTQEDFFSIAFPLLDIYV